MRVYRPSEGRVPFLRLVYGALGSALCVSACSDDGGERPSSFNGSTGGRQVSAQGGRVASGGSVGSGGTTEVGGTAGNVQAGAAPESGAGGEGGVPTTPTGGAMATGGIQEVGGERGLEPFETPPLCPGPDAWSEGTRLELSTNDDDRLFAMTPDELTMVWQAGEGIFYADRASAEDEFAEAVELEDTGFVQVAVSPDGLRLVGTRATLQAFAELVRESRDQAFTGDPDETAFADLNYAVSSIPVSRQIGDPLLVDELMIFSYYDSASDATWTIRQGSGPPWSFGVPIGGEMLLSVAGKRRIATGLGSDLRTLFYWDEVEEVEQAAERADPGGTFDRYASLGDRRGATPNTACDRLYYSAPGPEGDLDLFVATVP